MKQYYFFFLLFYSTFAVNGQETKIPVFPVLFENTITYYNASIEVDSNVIHLGSQQQFGAFSQNTLIYGFGTITHNSNALGVAFISEKEGTLISENRIKGTYIKKILLSANTSLNASVQVGLINTSLGATRSTAGASTWAPDLDIGWQLQSKNTILSSSINQLSNSIVTPLSQSAIFKRFYTIYFSQQIDLSPTSLIHIYAQNIILQHSKDKRGLKIDYITNDIFSTGIGINTNGYLFSIGFPKLIIYDQKFRLKIGYNHPSFSRISSNFQPFQLHISYSL